MISMLGQPWLTGSIDILAAQCGFGKGFIQSFGENLLTFHCRYAAATEPQPSDQASSRTVMLFMAVGASGMSRELRGAAAIASTTSRPLVTWPKMM